MSWPCRPMCRRYVSTGGNGHEVQFTPAEGFVGTAEIHVRVSDTGDGASPVASTDYTYFVNVIAPTANDDVESTSEDTPVTFSPLGNDRDPDAGTSLTITQVAGQAITSGGPAVVAEVLNLVTPSLEKAIMRGVEEKDPGLCEQIRNLMFVFEDVVSLDDRSLQRLLREIDVNAQAGRETRIPLLCRTEMFPGGDLVSDRSRNVHWQV